MRFSFCFKALEIGWRFLGGKSMSRIVGIPFSFFFLLTEAEPRIFPRVLQYPFFTNYFSMSWLLGFASIIGEDWIHELEICS